MQFIENKLIQEENILNEDDNDQIIGNEKS